jgi:hypothetical protein
MCAPRPARSSRSASTRPRTRLAAVDCRTARKVLTLPFVSGRRYAVEPSARIRAISRCPSTSLMATTVHGAGSAATSCAMSAACDRVSPLTMAIGGAPTWPDRRLRLRCRPRIGPEWLLLLLAARQLQPGAQRATESIAIAVSVARTARQGALEQQGVKLVAARSVRHQPPLIVAACCCVPCHQPAARCGHKQGGLRHACPPGRERQPLQSPFGNQLSARRVAQDSCAPRRWSGSARALPVRQLRGPTPAPCGAGPRAAAATTVRTSACERVHFDQRPALHTSALATAGAAASSACRSSLTARRAVRPPRAGTSASSTIRSLAVPRAVRPARAAGFGCERASATRSSQSSASHAPVPS